MRRHAKLETALGYRFQSRDLLQQALTHRSCGANNNERLEFFGDSVLNFIVTENLYAKFAHLREGDLTRMRAHLVCAQTLAEVARGMSLGEHIKLGAGEWKNGGARDSILANALEAVIGAVCLDGDLAAAREVIAHIFGELLTDISPVETDAKTRLQEWLQQKSFALPVYRIIAQSGPAHQPQFEVECRLPHAEKTFIAQGGSRRIAEQNAALHALNSLGANA